MRKLFAGACVYGLMHSHAYEWKSVERKVQCERPFTLACSNCAFSSFNNVNIFINPGVSKPAPGGPTSYTEVSRNPEDS